MCIFRTKTLPPPNPLIKVDMQQVLVKLKEVFPNAMILMSDSYYYTTTLEELKRFLKSDDTNEYRYISETFDCDDYSYRLMGMIHCVDWGALPFGILWTETPNGNHAVNVFVDEKNEVLVCEPQSDWVGGLNPAWKPYFVII